MLSSPVNFASATLEFKPMSKLLFRMRDVPDDEAEEVRELLGENDIAFFETFGGNWGISVAALWLSNEEQFDTARRLLDDYETGRVQRVKEEYRTDLAAGEAKTLWRSFLEHPVKFFAYMVLVAVVLVLSLQFFLSF
jgi:hypothetical protein